ncbi:MAG: alpha/beta fold hydrolase, partial [Acidimicrobiia bacterium]
DAVGRDAILTNVMFYWLTGTAGSSAQWYYEMMNEATWDTDSDATASWDGEESSNPAKDDTSADWAAAARGTAPPGVLVSKAKDIAIRRWAERDHNITHWAEYDEGGHFFAAEQPEPFADDVRTFFRSIR